MQKYAANFKDANFYWLLLIGLYTGVDGFGKITKVAAGYWTHAITDNIQEKKNTIEKFDFGIEFFKPTQTSWL